MKEPIIKIREIENEDLKEILENNDVIHVREDNFDEVFKKIDKKLEDKIKITHGIFKFSLFKQELEFFCRNTEKYLPLPLKFRDLLQIKYLQCWHIKTSIFRFGKRIPINCLVDEPIEFTIAHELDTDTITIAICHPKIQFRRKSGAKIVKQRMEWSLEHPDEERKWKYTLKK